MIVYRLTQVQFAKVLNGEGAALYGGRWNSKGVPIVYTGETRSLCCGEVAVHSPLGMVPTNYVMVTLFIPDDCSLKEIPLSKLPNDWNQFPYNAHTQYLGNAFTKEGKYFILKVPSATVEGEHNFLMNPKLSEIDLVKVMDVIPFNFDKRFFIR